MGWLRSHSEAHASARDLTDGLRDGIRWVMGDRVSIRVERAESFFERGRKLARLADRNQPIPPSTVIAFEDIESLLHVLTEKRVLLLKQVKVKPASISDLAKKLKRDRSAVTRDVQILERFGVLRVTEMPLPGHGRQKWITPVAREIQLIAQL
jgi:predicted transcriptional regulator